MTKPIANQVLDTMTAAGWSESGAHWAVVRIQSPLAAEQIAALAKDVPEAVRAVILRDQRHTTDEALIAAFKDAAEIRLLCGLPYCRGLPVEARSIENFVHGSGASRRLMTGAEARKKLVDALAEMDVHIDTTRRVDSGPVASIAEASARVWAARGQAEPEPTPEPTPAPAIEPNASPDEIAAHVYAKRNAKPEVRK